MKEQNNTSQSFSLIEQGSSNKITISWNPEAKAIIGTMNNQTISIDEIRTAILDNELLRTKANSCRAWIHDSTQTAGFLPKEQLDLISNEIFPTFNKIGIKYIITIIPTNSIFSGKIIRQYSSLSCSNRLLLVAVDSLEQAILWLKTYAN